MSYLPIISIGLLMLVSVIVLMVRPKLMFLAILLFLVVTVFGAWTFTDILGLPKPSQFELLAQDENVELLGVAIKPGQAIYLWIHVQGQELPRAFSFPWTEKQAKKVEKAEKTMKEGGQIKMSDLFGGDGDRSKKQDTSGVMTPSAVKADEPTGAVEFNP